MVFIPFFGAFLVECYGTKARSTLINMLFKVDNSQATAAETQQNK